MIEEQATHHIQQDALYYMYNVLPEYLCDYKFQLRSGPIVEIYAPDTFMASLLLIELGHTPVKILNPKEHD